MAFRHYGILGSVSIYLFLLMGALGTFLWYTISKALQGRLIGRFLSVVGRNSLRLMCIHIPFYEFFHTLGGHCNHILSSFISIGLCIVISIFIDKMIGRYESKVSFLRFL